MQKKYNFFLLGGDLSSSKNIVVTSTFFGKSKFDNIIPQSKFRGFDAGKVGPIDGGDFVGGNYVSALNATADLPIFENMETFDFNIFYDAANVWGVDYNSSMNDSSALRSSTGIGVDWYTPIGPLSFSFSQPLTKKSTDKTESFRFNLGTTF